MSTGQVEEIYGGHNIVRVFNKEETVTKTFRETNEKLYQSAWKSQFFSGMMMPVMQFVGNIGYVMVALVGGCRSSAVPLKSVRFSPLSSISRALPNRFSRSPR